MELINKELLDKVSDQAKESERLRMNYNFHSSLDAKAQRLLNALEPGTILPIHRHKDTIETYLLIRGEVKILFYNDNKEITESIILNPLNGEFGVNIPVNQWHTLEVIESESVIFEVKDGPYKAISSDDILE